ncbi:hypothetical protein [Aeromonas rivipollensis]|uniref:hypothetical protein n=1 Tax=Aeromonas rivipollensis TaxID=948519 RepID=UPI0038D13261
MNDVLSIIGSVASIASIPLAFYLYLKSQAEKILGVRKDIVNRLAFQLGEGRTLTIFEVQAVIDARLRENRLKFGSIRPNEVIEDLVTETIASPLLETGRKEEIVRALSGLHTLGKLYSAVQDSQKIFEDFLSFLRISKPDKESEQLVEAIKSEEIGKSTLSNQTPELFGAIASVIAVLSSLFAVADFSGAVQLLPKIFNNDILTSIGLGIAGSVIAALITFLIKRHEK